METEWKTDAAPVAYPDALSFMEDRVTAIAREGAAPCVWLLEHPPLYTAGTSAKPSDLLNARFPVFETGRGGEYTYHGPGQRVAYVMRRLPEADVKKYIWQLEEWIIRALGTLGVKGERRGGRVGIWVVHDGRESKIAAIGVRVRHWVAYHGISINVNPDLSHYTGIVPCGINDYGVTTLAALGCDAGMPALDAALRAAYADVFGESA